MAVVQDKNGNWITVPDSDVNLNTGVTAPQTPQGPADWTNFLQGFGGAGNTAVNNSWKNEKNSGLGGYGTAGQWETGLGAVNALGSLYGLTLQKEGLDETRANNAFNRDLSTANLNMKYDAFVPDFLQAQGKASAIGNWIGTQGGDASKYSTMSNLKLPDRPIIG